MNPITFFLNELQYVKDSANKGIAYLKSKISGTTKAFLIFFGIVLAVFYLLYVALRFILGGFDYYGLEKRACADQGLVWIQSRGECL